MSTTAYIVIAEPAIITKQMNIVALQRKRKCIEMQLSRLQSEKSRVQSEIQRLCRRQQEIDNQMLTHNRPTLNSISRPTLIDTTSIHNSPTDSLCKKDRSYNKEWLKVIQKYLPEEEVKNFPEGLLMENDPRRNRAVRSVLKENQYGEHEPLIYLHTEHTQCCKDRNLYQSEVSGNTIKYKMRPQSPRFIEMNFPVQHIQSQPNVEPIPKESVYGDKMDVLSNIEKRLEGYRVYEYMTRVWLNKRFEVNKVFLVTKKERAELKLVTDGLNGLAVYYASPQKTHHITLDLMIDMEDSKDAIFKCEFSKSHKVKCIREHLYGNRGTSECTKPRNAWQRPDLLPYLKTPQPQVIETPRDASKFSPPLRSNKRPPVGEGDACKRRRMFAPQQKSVQKSVFEKLRNMFVNGRGMKPAIQGMDYELRPPQRRFLNKVIEKEQFRYALNWAPTGTGKTDTTAMAHFVVKEVKKGLIVCDSTYVDDLHAQLKTFFDKPAFTQRVCAELIKKDGFSNIPDADVYIVGKENLADTKDIKSKSRKFLEDNEFDLVQFDEAHKGTGTRDENSRISVLERELSKINSTCHFIYHTATPTLMVRGKCGGDDNIYRRYSRHEAVQSGIIKDVRRVPYKNDDTHHNLFKQIIVELRKKRDALGIPIRAIILTNSVNSTQQCAREFNEYVNKTVCDDTYYAKPLTGKNFKKEPEIKDRFESLRFEDRPPQKRRIDVLFVCNKCVESYNNPMISVVGFAYSTKAGEVRIPQFIGRGLRKTPPDYIRKDIFTTEHAKTEAEKTCSIIYPHEMEKAIVKYMKEGTLAGCSPTE